MNTRHRLSANFEFETPAMELLGAYKVKAIPHPISPYMVNTNISYPHKARVV